MEQSELEKLIEELESRVDRLRSLYEQYFMGLEKLMPAVPHKDVERRLYVLRRQTIRNTGLRFRFQNVLLRYNSYSTYWMRIVRKIEEGTYKRDVRRANARFGPGAEQVERKRGRKRAADEELEVDVEFELDVDVDIDELDGSDGGFATFEDEEIAKAHAEVAKMRAALQSSRAQRAAAALPQASAPTPAESSTRRGRPHAEPAASEPATEPKIPVAQPSAPARGGLTYAVRGGQRASRLPPALPIAGVDSGPPPAPPSASEGASRRGSSRPAPRPSSRPIPAAPPATRAATRPRQPTPSARQVAPPSLSDERVRQLYTQLVETKRKVGESTAALTFESLSRSLRDSSEKLKQKHGGKNVDFEVAVKDGKAVLRPVVK